MKITIALCITLVSVSILLGQDHEVFPFYPPKDKPDMPLSAALERYYDRYDGIRPEENELYSQFRYTELKGFDYNPELAKQAIEQARQRAIDKVGSIGKITRLVMRLLSNVSSNYAFLMETAEKVKVELGNWKDMFGSSVPQISS